ncbi:hypothetical protein FRC08_000241, partial [Ceratobasidium sp. 394]
MDIKSPCMHVAVEPLPGTHPLLAYFRCSSQFITRDSSWYFLDHQSTTFATLLGFQHLITVSSFFFAFFDFDILQAI